MKPECDAAKPVLVITQTINSGTSDPCGGRVQLCQTRVKSPSRVWHYHLIEGLGEDVLLPFADICGCGDYRLTGVAVLNYAACGEYSDVESTHTSDRVQALNEFVASPRQMETRGER